MKQGNHKIYRLTRVEFLVALCLEGVYEIYGVELPTDISKPLFLQTLNNMVLTNLVESLEGRFRLNYELHILIQRLRNAENCLTVMSRKDWVPTTFCYGKANESTLLLIRAALADSKRLELETCSWEEWDAYLMDMQYLPEELNTGVIGEQEKDVDAGTQGRSVGGELQNMDSTSITDAIQDVHNYMIIEKMNLNTRKKSGRLYLRQEGLQYRVILSQVESKQSIPYSGRSMQGAVGDWMQAGRSDKDDIS